MTIPISILMFIFGAIIGSFLNVCIIRIPKQESIVTGGSHCTSCQAPVKPYDNIPILSYLILRGKCRQCKASFSPRYALIEALTGGIYVINYLSLGLTSALVVNLIFSSILIIIAFIDLDTMIINDRFQIIILALSIIWHIINQSSPINQISGALIVSIPLFIIAIVTGGIGGGDVKLMFVAGLYLGFSNTLVAFFIAAITGGIYALYLLGANKAGRKSEIPFGPFLCLGLLMSSLYGQQLFDWYLSLM